MARFNSFSSMLLLAIFMYSCITNSNATPDSLPISQDDQLTFLDNATNWDFNYGITQTGPGPYDLDRFWVNVYVHIDDGFRNLNISAALTKDGLYVYPGFARKLQKRGILDFGAAQFEYHVQTDFINIDDCAADNFEPLQLEGIAGTIIKSRDTWIKNKYKCYGAYSNPIPMFCKPEFGDFESFLCDTRLSNSKTNTSFPILQQRQCIFMPPCAKAHYLIKLLDAKQIQDCFQGNIYSSTTRCASRTRIV